jgi:mannose-6-phosphate isomerase-like protein (cupin superfamily)
VFKIMRPDDIPETDMEAGRGTQVPLVDARLGTTAIDLHINRLRAGGARGRVHRHTRSDNVYIVKRGEGTLTIEGETHTIRTDDVVFIPAGTRHSLSNLSDAPLELFEIYTPAGDAFDFVVDDS